MTAVQLVLENLIISIPSGKFIHYIFQKYCDAIALFQLSLSGFVVIRLFA